MQHLVFLMLTAVAMLPLTVALPGSDAVAQQKQRVSYKAAAENTKYPQQLNVDVGDVPNHIVRLFEIHRTYPNNAPLINGLTLVEEWDRAIADLTDFNGVATSYYVHLVENGDKFFARVTSVTQNIGSGKFTITAAGPILSAFLHFVGGEVDCAQLTAPGRRRLVDSVAHAGRQDGQLVLVGRMQPPAAEIERKSGWVAPSPGAPTEAAARLQDANRAASREPPCRGDSGSPHPNHDDVECIHLRSGRCGFGVQ